MTFNQSISCSNYCYELSQQVCPEQQETVVSLQEFLDLPDGAPVSLGAFRATKDELARFPARISWQGMLQVCSSALAKLHGTFISYPSI